VSWRGSLLAALLATLVQPRWWALALAGFLVRGGFVVVLLPIVVPPTVAGVSTMLAPTIVGDVVTGASTVPVAVLFAAVVGGLFAAIAIGGSIGSWFEAELVAEAAADDELGIAARARQPRPAGLGAARLNAHLLTAIVFVASAARIVAVIYAEATSPGSPTTPFVVRVVTQAGPALLTIVVTWLLAEAAGGLALRTLLLADAPAAGDAPPPTALRATWRGVRGLVRPASLATLVVANLALVVLAAPGALAASRAWAQLRLLLIDGADAGGLAIGVFLFVAVVIGWLTLLAVGLAWRATLWTAVSIRER
jgi:hypothetical protein